MHNKQNKTATGEDKDDGYYEPKGPLGERRAIAVGHKRIKESLCVSS
jgi:hypothetical protein